MELRVEKSVTKFLCICVERVETDVNLPISNYPPIYSTVNRFRLSEAKTVATQVSNRFRVELDEMVEPFEGILHWWAYNCTWLVLYAHMSRSSLIASYAFSLSRRRLRRLRRKAFRGI